MSRVEAAPGSLTLGAARLLIADLDTTPAPNLKSSARAGGFADSAERRAGRFQASRCSAPAERTRRGRYGGRRTSPADRHRRRRAGDARGQQGREGVHWQVLRPRCRHSHGRDQASTLGIGGEVEFQIRTGLHVQKQAIRGSCRALRPGRSRSRRDRAGSPGRNGVLQSDSTRRRMPRSFAEQRLKGSCPVALRLERQRDGLRHRLIWRSPLGIRSTRKRPPTS